MSSVVSVMRCVFIGLDCSVVFLFCYFGCV